MPSSNRSTPAATWLTAAALAVGACGGAAASATPSVAPVPSATTAPATSTPEPATPTVVPPSPTPSASPSPTAAASLATSGRIEIADKGFAVTLPDGWVRIDLTAGDLEAIIAGAGQVSPELAKSYSAQVKQLLAAGLVVFAFGPGGEARANLNILALPSMGLSMDLLEQMNRSQIEPLADGDVMVERVELPAGDALHFSYRVKAEGQASPSIDQFMLLAGDQQLVVTLTSGTAAQAKAISTSIELLD